MGADPVFVERVWNLADRLDGEADRRRAHAVLASDSSSSARTVATLVLGNFMDDDRSWHALVSSVIDPHPHHVVNTVARSMLEGMHEGMVMGRMTRQRDPVDWSGARSPLSAIFGGTNLPAFSTILQVLVVTGIEPQLAQQLARESPDLLLAYAGAEHGPTRIPALNFLRAMGGEDFGTDVDAWRAWIARISGTAAGCARYAGPAGALRPGEARCLADGYEERVSRGQRLMHPNPHTAGNRPFFVLDM